VDQRRGQHEEFPGQVEIERADHFDVFQILPRDQGNGDVVDVELVFLDQMEEKVQGTLEDIELDLIIHS